MTTARVGDAVAPARARSRRWLEVCAVIALIAVGWWVRVDYTLRAPGFDAHRSDGVLTTDPAFIAYLTARIVAAGGSVPDDFRADPRVEHPDLSDDLAMFTVGQEFAIAWAKLWLGADTSLHVVALWLMSLCAAATALGIHGCARALTGSGAWALLAAGLWAVLPASYRTLGVILIREDFALPLLALHFWALAAAVRRPSGGRMFLAGASAGVAVATWHAAGTMLTVECACLIAWFVRTGRNPMAPPRAWTVLLGLWLSALIVPVLRAKGFFLAPPVATLAGLLVAAQVSGRGRAVGAFVATAAATLALGAWITPAAGDYGHVGRLLLDKITRLGAVPVDPAGIAFDTILLWQGPFMTATLDVLTSNLGAVALAALAVPLIVRAWRRGTDVVAGGLGLFVAATFVGTLLVVRLQVVAAVAGCVLVAVTLAQWPRRRLAWALAAVAIAFQVTQMVPMLRDTVPWWAVSPGTVRERAEMVAWVREHVPPSEAIATDFLNGAGLLYHTGHPILQQPKYETARSRRKIEDYFVAFYHRKPAGFARWLRNHDCRWVMIDRDWMWGSRNLAGVTLRATALTGPAAAVEFLFDDDGVIPGFELMFESSRRQGRGNFRVYRLQDR